MYHYTVHTLTKNFKPTITGNTMYIRMYTGIHPCIHNHSTEKMRSMTSPKNEILMCSSVDCKSINIKGKFSIFKGYHKYKYSQRYTYLDISLTTGLYVKYTLVGSFDLKC